MSFPKWCLFFDFHTMPANPDVGKAFDFEAIADRFQQAGVQYVVFPARCNLGVAYYDTKIGIRHPALTHNLLKELADACHCRSIKLTAYMNLGLSHEEGLRHRDWLVMDADGRTYQQNRLDSFFRQMCYNTEYGDHAVAMVREILETTGVDGLFLDCMHTRPCFGKECTDAMTAEAGAPHHQVRDLIMHIAVRITDCFRTIYGSMNAFREPADFDYAGLFSLHSCADMENWLFQLCDELFAANRALLGRSTSVVGLAVDYITLHFREGVTLRQVAADLHVNTSYLGQIFRKETGSAFTDYVNTLRIREAQRLLSNPTMRVYEIAEQVGYTDYHYFLKIFKKVIGKSPSDLRN